MYRNYVHRSFIFIAHMMSTGGSVVVTPPSDPRVVGSASYVKKCMCDLSLRSILIEFETDL